MPLAFWIHQPHPFLVEFSPGIGIRYYGLAYLLGFAAAIWLLHRYARAGRSQLSANLISDLMVGIVFGVLLGGRLGFFLFYQPATLIERPLEILRVWDGGMASHGGFIGVAVALWWFARKHQLSFLHLGDLIVSTAPVGLLLGRIANFINGELWGTPSVVSWAVVFKATGGGPMPRHPSQLYEALLEGALLLILVQWRFWRSAIVRVSPGRLSGEFLLAYAVLRSIAEQFREPDAALILGLSRGTFYSIFLVAAGLALILRSRRTES